MKISPKSYIVLAVLVVAIGASAYMYLRNSANNTQTATQQAQPTTNSPSTSTDKQYCSTSIGACFAYPAEWSSPQTSDRRVRFDNPARTIIGELSTLPQQNAATSTFYTVTVEPVDIGSKQVTRIGGYYTAGPALSPGKANTVPAFYLVENSQVRQYQLTAGSSQPAPENLGITMSGGLVIRFACGASDGSVGQDWFSSAETQVCKNLLQSFSLN